MTPADIYRAYIAAENAGDRPGMEEWLSADLTVEVNGVATLADRAADAAATAALLAHYPDYYREVHEVLVDGDRLAARWTMRGTPPPGAAWPQLELHGCTVATVCGGRIVAASLYADGEALDRALAVDDATS